MISIAETSSTPKYKQIVNSIEDAIVSKSLKQGDALPSLNSIRDAHNVSRDTVLSAFGELKTRGIIHSVAGKGYYVASEDVHVERKIFLLFDEMNAFKEDIYNHFLQGLGSGVQVDIFFHHFNSKVFQKLIAMNAGLYNTYIIMPSNLNNAYKSLEQLPNHQVFILDQTNETLASYPSVHQNFQRNVFEGLSQCADLMVDYNRLVLVNMTPHQPKGIELGLKQFCQSQNLKLTVLRSELPERLKIHDIYMVLDDRTLVELIKKIKDSSFKLGEDIGIIAYNDTLLKTVFEGGITTISTDFAGMGKRLARMVLDEETEQIENEYKVMKRQSL